VILNGEDGQVPMTNALHSAVVQVYVADLQFTFQGVGVQGIAMVLGSDIDSAGG
jgi:hypothetical protein